MKFPRMAVVEQQCRAPRVPEVCAAVTAELQRLNLGEAIPRGGSVAITAGSRHITDIGPILSTLARFVRSQGGAPFVVPAMGSHGGATAEGQAALLAGYGITEETVAAPIVSSMEVEKLGATQDGHAVYMDRRALSADRILVVNRVKAHTQFFGKVESGLTKMLLVGLGKREGAEEMHRAARLLGFDRVAAAASRIALQRARVAFGLAIVENALGETAHVEAAMPDQFIEIDARLLALANALSLTLPFNPLDLLIVDRMGKDISGTGMDVNVIGAREGSPVRISRIFVRDLTDESKGNAHGIGLAHLTTTRLVRKIDTEATLQNAHAAMRPEGAKIPPAFETDRECLENALASLPARPRIVQIRDTLHLARCRICEALLAEVRQRTELQVISPPEPLQFDAHGDLVPWD